MRVLLLVIALTVTNGSLIRLYPADRNDVKTNSYSNTSHLSLLRNNYLHSSTLNSSFNNNLEHTEISQDFLGRVMEINNQDVSKESVIDKVRKTNKEQKKTNESDFIYNGTKLLTIIFLVLTVFMSLVVILFSITQKYIKKISDKFVNQDSCENEGIDWNEVNYNTNLTLNTVELSNIENIVVSNFQNRQHSKRRHSLAPNSTDNLSVIPRPRSASSLPFVQTLIENLDDVSTTTDSRSSKNNGANITLKTFLKKRNTLLDSVSKDNAIDGNRSLSSSGNLGDQEYELESGESPKSASTVVAVQMGDFLARWNPKRDSRLYTKDEDTPVSAIQAMSRF
ncbi:uncharacterized protein CMU_019590 [Cryptosporidium muris RN66]|uniref:Uncharacterized protein n=1 Tax=Cryptosporidium muris (strain RN66) TaxID=441375 RepID=B6ACE6_CRYMR|nr:uncharacterized protein CMU_019590 [Cryptosporidium muris RN66]EEA06202.1 hypothetical protein, conserved [Cryptosporidium muris RN66]|eukprot:XP_002140551.1 hypothetical protein [Cryptosporidium muris RN66]